MNLIKKFFKNIIPNKEEVKLIGGHDLDDKGQTKDEQAPAEKVDSPVKKKPGRPKGSTSKKTPSKKTPSKKTPSKKIS